MTIFSPVRRSIRHLRHDQRAVATMEFGFAAIPIFMMMLGAFETGYYMFAQSVLEGAAREAARQGITGYVPCDMTREAYIQSVIDDAMLQFTDPDARRIEKRVYKSFNDIGKPEPYTDANGNGQYDAGEFYNDVNGNLQWDADMASAGLGGPGDVVVYDITYTLQSLTGFFAHAIGAENGLELTARTAVRNEPAGIGLGGGGPCGL